MFSLCVAFFPCPYSHNLLRLRAILSFHASNKICFLICFVWVCEISCTAPNFTVRFNIATRQILFFQPFSLSEGLILSCLFPTRVFCEHPLSHCQIYWISKVFQDLLGAYAHRMNNIFSKNLPVGRLHILLFGTPPVWSGELTGEVRCLWLSLSLFLALSQSSCSTLRWRLIHLPTHFLLIPVWIWLPRVTCHGPPPQEIHFRPCQTTIMISLTTARAASHPYPGRKLSRGAW